MVAKGEERWFYQNDVALVRQSCHSLRKNHTVASQKTAFENAIGNLTQTGGLVLTLPPIVACNATNEI